MVFAKLLGVAVLRDKIREHKPVSIGVFCSGNADRSPLAEAVLRREFVLRGYSQVKIFSFGTSVSPAKHLGSASERTTKHALDMGYHLIVDHKRRHIGDVDVQKEIADADLLLAISPSHAALAAEYIADEYPKAADHILGKTWTLKGFADKREWTLPFRRRLGRGLALNDPYFHPKTPEGELAFRKDLKAVERASKRAVERLVH